jgi:hypothetical protein
MVPDDEIILGWCLRGPRRLTRFRASDSIQAPVELTANGSLSTESLEALRYALMDP